MRWRNWAAYVVDTDGKRQPQIAPTDVIGFVNNQLFEYIKHEMDANGGPQHRLLRDVFSDTNNYMKSGTQFLAVVEKLEEAIDFHDLKKRASLGDVYEQLLNDLRSAGNAGEFYTPRALTQFMVNRVAPGLTKHEKVLDPACGTGGFLTATIDHFLSQRTTKSSVADQRAVGELIHGIEKKPLPHLLCTTNMLLHNIDVADQIEHKNTLAIGWNDWSGTEKVDCVVTNPPFGGYEDDGVGGDYPADLRTRETADMFMALIIKKLLKDHGRAAVVLPDGFLFGEGIKGRLKELLLRDCKLHTIVRLPKGVFAPYTTIKTNLLFFTKGATRTDGNDTPLTDTIWFYEHPYPDGYKSYSKTKPIRLEEFQAECDWWGKEADDFASRKENEHAWKVDFKTKYDQARAAAQPHWDKAQELNNLAFDKDNQVRDLRDSISGVTDTRKRKAVDAQIAALREEADALRTQAKDAQAAGDRIYWPIYNLDLKNPNAPEAEVLDPDQLLEQYTRLLGDIEETENRLKSELGAVLAQHFDTEGA